MRIAWFAAGVIIAAGATALALDPLYMSLDSDSNRALGTVISAKTVSASQNTGWMNVEGFAEITFEVTAVDADDSVTNFVMDCESSRVSSTTLASGADVCARDRVTGVSTYTCPHQWKHNPTNGAVWTWTLEHVPDRWLNCTFSAEGVPAAGDTVTVYATGRTP